MTDSIAHNDNFYNTEANTFAQKIADLKKKIIQEMTQAMLKELNTFEHEIGKLALDTTENTAPVEKIGVDVMPEPTPVAAQTPVEVMLEAAQYKFPVDATPEAVQAPAEITPEAIQVEEHTLPIMDQNITPSVPMSGEGSNQHIEL